METHRGDTKPKIVVRGKGVSHLGLTPAEDSRAESERIILC